VNVRDTPGRFASYLRQIGSAVDPLAADDEGTTLLSFAQARGRETRQPTLRAAEKALYSLREYRISSDKFDIVEARPDRHGRPNGRASAWQACPWRDVEACAGWQTPST
jgi:hypothetical protein